MPRSLIINEHPTKKNAFVVEVGEGIDYESAKIPFWKSGLKTEDIEGRKFLAYKEK